MSSFVCGAFNPRCTMCDIKLTGITPVLKFTILSEVLKFCPCSSHWTFYTNEEKTVVRRDWKYCEIGACWYCEGCNDSRRTYQRSICAHPFCSACDPNVHEMDLYFVTYFVWRKVDRHRMHIDSIDGYIGVMARMRQTFFRTKAEDEVPCFGLSDYERSYFRFLVLKIGGLGVYFKIILDAKYIREFIDCLHRMFVQLEDYNDTAAVAVLNAVCNDTCVPVTEEEYMMFKLLHSCDPSDEGTFAYDEVYMQPENNVRRIYYARTTRKQMSLAYPQRELENALVPLDSITEIANRGRSLGTAMCPCIHVDPRIPRPWRVSFMRQTAEVKKNFSHRMAQLREMGDLKIYQVFRFSNGICTVYNIPLGLDLLGDAVIGFYFHDDGKENFELTVELHKGSVISEYLPPRIIDDKFCYLIQGEFDVLFVRGQYISGPCPCVMEEGQMKCFSATIDQVLRAEKESDTSICDGMVFDDSNIETFLGMKNTRGIDFWLNFSHNNIRDIKPLSMNL